MPNCGEVRNLPLDFRDQKFGCEIEMTGITRQQAAEAVGRLFGTSARQTHESRVYDPWEVKDADGKKWRFVYDSSIQATRRVGRRQEPAYDLTYKVELNSPVLEYAEMGKLQEVVRALRHAGAVVNPSCGLHVHIDASKHTPRSLRNLLSIMYSKEDLIFAALGAQQRRVERYCKLSRENVVKVVRNMPPGLTMEQLRRAWYEGRDGVTARTTITTGRGITRSICILCFTMAPWSGAALRARCTQGKSAPTSRWRWPCRPRPSIWKKRWPARRRSGITLHSRSELFCSALASSAQNTRMCGCTCSSVCPATLPGCATATSTKVTSAAIIVVVTRAEGGIF